MPTSPNDRELAVGARFPRQPELESRPPVETNYFGPGPRHVRGRRDPSSFTVVRKGFDRTEVIEKIDGLSSQLATERQRADYAEQELRQALNRINALEQAVGSPHGFGDRVEKLLVLAEEQAADITERAEQHAHKIVQHAQNDAESHRRDVEQSLAARAATLDQEANRRSAALQRREDEIAADRIAARAHADDLRATAEREAATVRERAEAEATDVRAKAQAEARAERDKGSRDLARLVDMQDGVRAEMGRVNHVLGELRAVLTGELATSANHAVRREPAALPAGTTAGPRVATPREPRRDRPRHPAARGDEDRLTVDR